MASAAFAAAPAGNDPKPVVSIKDVTHLYKKVVALDGISLDIPAGIMVGIVGPDGVGKSTLMALVAGSKKLQDGTITVLGRRHRQRPPPARGRTAHRLHAAGAGQEPVPRAQRLRQRRLHGAAVRAVAGGAQGPRQGAAAATGLGPFADRPAGKLSGGMKQKVGLCGALVHDPDLLILDEPTTGVDPLSRRQFWALIDDIRAGARA
jgi:ribosome-dependent ATPase